MAKKTKKPKHTNLVLPGENKKGQQAEAAPPRPDRLGRMVDTAPVTAAPEKTAAPKDDGPVFRDPEKLLGRQTGQVPPGKGSTGRVEGTGTARTQRPFTGRISTDETAPGKALPLPKREEVLPDNAIVMPPPKKKLSPVKRKRLFRRLRGLLVLLLIPALVLFFYSGAYSTLAMRADELYDSVRIALSPGEGYPAPFRMIGFLKAEGMGDGGFAALGEADLALYSATGKELVRVQHGYVSPNLVAADRRVCLWPAGGKEYTVVGRQDTLARQGTENEILFCQLSPGGWLAVATGTHKKATLEVYDPLYPEGDPELRWSLDDARPVTAAFNDDRTLAMGCVKAQGGALGSVLHLLRTDRTEPQATIEALGSVVLQMEYLSANRLLVVYDTHAALYTAKGEALARYDYGGKTLFRADITAGNTALVFGSSARESAELTVLDASLNEKFTTTAETAANIQPLAAASGAYLLSGRQVLAFDNTGLLAGVGDFDRNVYALVEANGSLALTATSAEPIDALISR